MKPTKQEKEWIRKMQNLLTNPPSERIGLAATGYDGLIVYDKTCDDQIDEIQNKGYDFCIAVNRLGAEIGFISSYITIHSTSA